MKLTPQQDYILSFLREGGWVCGSRWLNRVKDDRKRISELNQGYLRDRGYEIIGTPCRGKACGRKKCPLFMRLARKINDDRPTEPTKGQVITKPDGERVYVV